MQGRDEETRRGNEEGGRKEISMGSVAQGLKTMDKEQRSKVLKLLKQVQANVRKTEVKRASLEELMKLNPQERFFVQWVDLMHSVPHRAECSRDGKSIAGQCDCKVGDELQDILVRVLQIIMENTPKPDSATTH